MRVVIAGNGILALATAHRLSRQLTAGDSIRIVGPSHRPGSATLAAAAMLNSFAELEAGGLRTELDRFRFELSRRATPMWPQLLDELQGPTQPLGRGTYVIDAAPAGGRFDAILAALASFREPHQLVSLREIPDFSPRAPSSDARAVFLPNEGWLNPRLAMRALEHELSLCSQVRFVDGAVHRLHATGAALHSVTLSDGSVLHGDQFLVAPGASMTGLLDRSELGLPIQRVHYGVGVSLELQLPEAQAYCIRTPGGAPPSGVYTVPYFVEEAPSEPHVLIGATHVLSAAPVFEPPASTIDALVEAAKAHVHSRFERSQVVRVNVGWRPTSEDGFPLLGKTSISNLLLATGTRRDGFHLAPLLSGFLADTLLGRPVDPRFSVFAPERKPIAPQPPSFDLERGEP